MRVERWFAFVDVSGFTAFTEREGDQAAVEVLGGFRAAVRQVASEEGVRVGKWLGDGAMFVAVEPGHLVAAVLEVVEGVAAAIPLPLRAGIAGGPVILFEGDDYIGTPVNLAARLCDAAGPHDVLVTAEVAAFAPEGVVREDADAFVLPGFAQPTSAVRLRPPSVPDHLPVGTAATP